MEHWQITPEITGRDPVLRHAIVQALDAVRLGHHLLIEGEPGSGRRLLARCAWSRHGHGEQTMLTVNCQMFGAEAVESLIFGDGKQRHSSTDMLTVPLSGGLLLLQVESLPKVTQFRLGAALSRQRAVAGPPRLQVILAGTAVPSLTSELLLVPGLTRVWVPPLRQRTGDIPALVEVFLRQISPYERILCSPELMDRLCGYDWPENVAELRSVIRRLLMLPHHGYLDVAELMSLVCQDGRSLGLIHGIPPTRVVTMPTQEEGRVL